MDVPSQNSTDLNFLVTSCHVAEIKHGEDKPIDVSDFVNYIALMETKLIELQNSVDDLLRENKDSLSSLCEKQTVINFFILFGENCDRFKWNNDRTYHLIQDLRKTLEGYLGNSVDNVLINGFIKEKTTIRSFLRPILLELRPKLLKSTWKRYPASVRCYVWLLSTISFPNLGDIVQDVLPTALIISDDFVNENRVLGVICLKKIIDNLTIAELKFHGYGQLMYKVLEHLLRERDGDVALAVIPCILTLVSKLETDVGDLQSSYKWCRYDDVLEILLEIIEIEHLVELRSIYISLLPCIINSAGDRIIRWSKRVLRLLDHYLEVSARNMDEQSLVHGVKALRMFMEVSIKYSKLYRDDVVFIMFRLLCQLGQRGHDDDNYKEVQLHCMDCLKFIFTFYSEEEKTILKDDVCKELVTYRYCNEVLKYINSV